MARLDVKTLVLAFENRISALEKNPPDKVPLAVILNLLENAVEEVIKDHFKEIIRQDLEQAIKEQFKQMKDEYISKITETVFMDEEFKIAIQNNLKSRIFRAFEK